MSYAGKSHAHRDEKNDYNRLNERDFVEKELDALINGQEEDDTDDFDYVGKASEICSKEYIRGVKESRIKNALIDILKEKR